MAKLDHVGLAVITVRAEVQRDFEGTMRQVAAIGYRDLDMYIYESTLDAPATRAILDRVGLACTSARVRTTALYRGWERFLDAANVLGAKFITLADVPFPERQTLQDYHELAALFNRCAAIAQQHGLTFCYHNHDAELTPMEGAIPYDIVVAETDPTLVHFQMDVYWMLHGGRDPVHELRRLAGRVSTLHLKDMQSWPRRGITTVGRGRIDFRDILRTAIETGMRYWYVEEDAPVGPGIEAVRSAYTYLSGLDV
jgi:sugar phosphate isomerase/epimerase